MRACTLVALVSAAGVAAATARSGSDVWRVPAVEYHTFAYTYTSGAVSKCQHSYWSTNGSEVTDVAPPQARPHRFLPVSGIGSRPEWWIAFEVYVPSSYPSVGLPGHGGAIVNFHNVPHDVGWGDKKGTSPILINLESTRPNGFYVSLSRNDSILRLPRPKLDAWTSVLVHVVFGLSSRARDEFFADGFDGAPVRTGLLEVWVDGKGPYRVTNANLLNWRRSKRRPAWVLQRWVQVWQGGPYSGKGFPCDPNENAPAGGWVHAQTAARFGYGAYPDGLRMALADRPVLKGAAQLALGQPGSDIVAQALPGYESKVPLVPPTAIGYGQKGARRSYAVRLPGRDPNVFVLPQKLAAGLRTGVP